MRRCGMYRGVGEGVGVGGGVGVGSGVGEGVGPTGAEDGLHPPRRAAPMRNAAVAGGAQRFMQATAVCIAKRDLEKEFSIGRNRLG